MQAQAAIQRNRDFINCFWCGTEQRHQKGRELRCGTKIYEKGRGQQDVLHGKWHRENTVYKESKHGWPLNYLNATLGLYIKFYDGFVLPDDAKEFCFT